MTFTKTGATTWKSKDGSATIYVYHSGNSSTYYLNMKGDGADHECRSLNDAKRYAKELKNSNG